MVIITTIVAKIYFPESLERSSGNSPATATAPTAQMRRNYSYHRRPTENQHEDELADDNLIGLMTSSNSADEDDDDDEALYSEEEEEDDHPPNDNDSFLDDVQTPRILEFDQEHTSRAQVLRRLLFCSLMLNLTFVTWGALQERMLTRKYPRKTGDYFTYSYALVFTNRFWTLILSGLLLLYLKPRLSRSTVIYEYSFPSISNMLSSWCQYEALRYVSFPATTLFKSFKLAPVMLMGKILGNKTCM